MKKSLVFMIAVLLVGALMISCNSEVAGNAAGDGKVVTVGVNLDNSSKALQTSVTNDTNVAGLYWFYTATKTDGSLFITGQTSGLTPIDANSTAAGYQAGLQGAVLGDFSTGGWKFSFYGYAAINGETFNESSTPTGNPVYKCENLEVTVTDDTNLNVTIEAGAGMGAAKLVFSNPTWTYSLASEGTSLTLKVIDGTSQIATDTASTDSEGKATFSNLPDNLTLIAGSHTLTFNVFYGSEKVGKAELGVVAKNGTTITVSGSIENLDSLNTVTVATVTNTVATAEITPSSTSTTVVTAAVTPASASAVTAQDVVRNTIVTFPSPVASSTNNENGTTTVKSSALTIDVSTLKEANSNASFTVADGLSAVAAIDLSLTTTTTEKRGDTVLSTSESNVTNNFGGTGIVIVETYIASGLTNVVVYYNSGSNNSSIGSSVASAGNVNTAGNYYYNSENGYLKFATDHFSEFYVGSSNGAVNVTKNIAYDTVISAVSAASTGDTIMLLKNNELSSGEVVINHGITLDGNGYTYSNTRAEKDLTYNDNKKGRDAAVFVNTSETVTFKNLTVNTEKIGSVFVGTKVSSNGFADPTKADNGKIIVTNCHFNAPVTTQNARYCFFVNNGVSNLNVTIESSELTGWAAIYSKSKNSSYTINNSTLYGYNSASEHSSNSFGTIVLENFDSNHANTDTTKGNTVTVSSSTIKYDSASSNLELWLCLQYGAAGNNVSITDSSIIRATDNTTPDSFKWEAVQSNDIARNSNIVTVNGNSINDWVLNGNHE